MTRQPGQFLKRKESTIPPSYFHRDFGTAETMQATLALPPAQRTQQQVAALVDFSRDIKFFAEMSESMSKDAHFECCRHLSYFFCQAGRVRLMQFVFHEGEEGSRFYIILAGSCSVLSSRSHSFTQLTILRQGECFGELALISKKPRAASVLCREDCHFAVLERDDYIRILAKAQDQKLQEKVEILQRHPVFSVWTKSSVQRLSYFFKVRVIKRKQVLFEAGRDVAEVFFVKAGEFQLAKEVLIDIPTSTASRTTRCSVHVTLVGVGEILCAEELLKGERLLYTCTCHSTVGEVMAISREDFKRIAASEEAVGYLLSATRAKQIYRETRLAAAVKIEREKRTVKDATFDLQDVSTGVIRKALMKRKVKVLNLASASVSVPQSRATSPTYSRCVSIMGLSAASPETGLKDHPRHQKSWSDILAWKYSPRRPVPLSVQKPPAAVNVHTQSLKEVSPKLTRIWSLFTGQCGSRALF